MNGRTRIFALDGSPVEADLPDDQPPGRQPPADADTSIDPPPPAVFDPPGARRWIVPGVAAALIAAWTGAFALGKAGTLHGPLHADTLVEWVAQWAMPVALVLLGVLIARHTLRDISRHAAVVQALSGESRLLEARLRSMNTELSLARDFIAAQSRDLESLGRVAVERLAGSAERLKEVISGQGQDLDNIGIVAATALDNITALRAHLPVASNSTKDLANAIAHAGRTADGQLAALIAAFNRLDSSSASSARKVTELYSQVEIAVSAFARAGERIGMAGESRLEAVIMTLADQRERLDREEAAALAKIRERAEALAADLARAVADIGRDQEHLITAAGDRLNRFEASAGALGRALREEAGQIDATLDAQHERQREAIAQLAAVCASLEHRVAGFASTIAGTADESSRTAAQLDDALATLTARLDSARTVLGDSGASVANLTAAAARLLELVEAASDHTRTQLPEALRSAIAGLGDVDQRVVGLRDTLREAGDAGAALSGTVDQSRNRLGTVLDEIATINATVLAHTAEQEARLAAMRVALRAARTDSDALGEAIEARLAAAIAELEQAARTATGELGEAAAAQISAIAARFGDEASAALAQVAQGEGAKLVNRLESAMDSASRAARDTAGHLRDQLAGIDELAGNLEIRVSQLRDRAEDHIDSDFARRTALITESLNSIAIDISRILSAEVSESAWAAYLRGERGIFTRRAVSLLDSADARAVQHHYEADEEFRIHVNRYIHDFEAMLRQLLATRDGNAVGVTLLSSDMGKLYVALAQGIERLRT